MAMAGRDMYEGLRAEDRRGEPYDEVSQQSAGS